MRRSIPLAAGVAAAVLCAGAAGAAIGSGGWRTNEANAAVPHAVRSAVQSAVPTVVTPGVPCASNFPFAAGGSGNQVLANLDGVVGPVKIVGHVGDFSITKLDSNVISSLACGASGGGGGGGGTGRAFLEDIVFIKPVDIATPKLLEGTTTGKHYKTLKIAQRRASDGHEPFRMVLSDVLVVADNIQWMSGNPIEHVRVQASKFEWEIRPNVNGTGVVKYCFNVATNAKC